MQRLALPALAGGTAGWKLKWMEADGSPVYQSSETLTLT